MTDEPPKEEDSYRREQMAQKRHEENIQILVALGILGGYITLLSGGLFTNQTLNFVMTALASVTLLFLAVKLTLHSAPFLKESHLFQRIDEVSSKIQLVSIHGFIVLIASFLVSNQLDIPLSELGDYAGSLAFAIPTILFPVIMYYGANYRHTRARDQSTKIRERLPDALDCLEDSDVLSEEKRQSLEGRYMKILDIDREKGMWATYDGGFLMLLDDDTLCLRRPERELLLSTIERVVTRAEYDDYDADDLATIEAILDKAERRYTP